MTRILARTVVLVALLMVLVVTPAFAFDTGGGPSPAGYTCDDCHASAWGDGPHGAYTATTSKCDACHTLHDASGSVALTSQDTITNVCNLCHDGTGGFGVYGTVFARTGSAAGSGHSIDTTSVIPGGNAATGGSASAVFAGVGGKLGCSDCHSPHDANTVADFVGERKRAYTFETYATSHLLKQRPTSSTTTATAYGSDWCAGCHAGRASGGAVHTHPVDSKLTQATPYDYSGVPQLGYAAGIGIDVDAAGNVFVCDPGNVRVQKLTSTGSFLMSFTGGSLTRPTDVAVTPTGVLIADIGISAAGAWNADGSFSSYPFIDPPLGPKDYPGTAFVDYAAGNWAGSMWGGVWGPGWGADLSFPVRPLFGGMARDGSAGRVYVSETMADQIWSIDAGAGVTKWGSRGTGTGQFDQPSAVDVDAAGNIYVCDTGNHRVQVLNSSGGYVRSWGTMGTGNGQFMYPAGIAVDTVNSLVYVVDTGNARIQKFTLTGTYVGQFGSQGSGNGQFALPFNKTKIMAMVPRGVPGAGQFADYILEGGFVMPYPRSTEQQGHGPICQQCHEDSRDVGSAEGGGIMQALANIGQDGLQAGPWTNSGAPLDPQFQNFPHETVNANMLVESNDDLCLNCHPSNQLP